MEILDLYNAGLIPEELKDDILERSIARILNIKV